MINNKPPKIHLANPNRQEQPICLSFKHALGYNLQITNDKDRITCNKCKQIIEITKQKETLEELEEYFKDPYSPPKEITRKEYHNMKEALKRKIYTKKSED